MFDSLQDRLQSAFKGLRGKGKLSDADIDAVAREIRVALLDADVAVPVVREFISNVKERARGAEVSQALNPAQQVIKIVNDELVRILGGETRRIRFAKNPPTVIMLAGLQGAGKTTLAGKLGRWLKAQGHSPMLVAADLQRPNAVTQLKVVGDQAGVTVFAPEAGNVGGVQTTSGTQSIGDPVQVARDAITEAKRTLHDVVVIDTAGRLAIDADLMKQARDIRDATQPDEVLFVIDAMIGQDAVGTAEAFLEGVDFTGVVLSKLDGDARGGAALSVRSVTGRPIMFASTGEKLDEFDVFHPDRMASRILDMGDVMTLIEQAEKVMDAEQAAAAAEKVAGGSFTLADFLQQMEALSKMGSMTKMLGMLPGMGQFKDQLANFDEKDIDKIKAIIRSMTPAERDNPKIIDGSRRARIARGSGTQVSDVNQLVTRFFEAAKMMQRMAKGGGMPGMPGMGGMPGMPGMGAGKRAGAKQPKQANKKKGKRVSGNPAKRAAAAKAEPTKPAGAGAFGFDANSADDFELPKELRDLL
ncbi:signal recognition particle protein [Aeromicrobium sp. 636]|uniref:Signal recognition particle protein n=1 Tax=Aeromicrobium senzhongii TaxID=2663859 RepID=A0A8I0EU68_9ACTN|nr:MULTISPECIES: signal recognition particle protein [Aeromicrobium]MBC9225140.1 signal recognition particle protein [Aeromicrobium senzhongii]MCQ3997250.1 signal recognition particle protein [Aeromicrobium sp. 636]MTB87182.1 signal recognition particle protein [Aeromicrobium senzhongii]QNL95740.1 signal recognition particle protein [Aeromicrobium senzhongii]